MPIARRDPVSGALIFDLTPEEIELKTLKEELESLKETVNSIKKITSTTLRGEEYE